MCAAFDPDAEAALLRHVSRLQVAGVPVAAPPRNRPHITLAAARTTPGDLDRVVTTARQAAGRRPFPVRLDHLGVFPGGGVLWLGPRPSSALAALQRDADAALLAAGWGRAFGAQSDPQSWTAHCTLATRLRPDDLAKAVRDVARGFREITARVERLVVIVVGGSEIAVVPFDG